jgi:class 3 adenylate cyclase
MERHESESTADLAARVEALRMSLHEERAKSARLEGELAGALEQQAATSEILNVISGSPADVQPVFEAIADSVMRLFDAWSASVFRHEDGLIRLAAAHEGTLERFTGDGMMIFFNDPVPVADAPARAVRMALAMRERMRRLDAGWRKRGYELGVGIGIAQGYATIGAIGFEGRWDYGAIGTVTNLAARLCGEARPGDILVSQRVAGAVEDLVSLESVGALTLKGLARPVPACRVLALKTTG